MSTPQQQTVQQLLLELDESSDRTDWSQLESLANLTALRNEQPDGYFISNFWRGPLLYALVKRLAPANILELGTGRGYGAMAMAQAAQDSNLDTKIWSIDSIPTSQKQTWHFDNGQGPQTEMASIDQFWDANLPNELNERITVLHGDCASVAGRWDRLNHPKADLVFIDAAHTYIGVKGDFLATLKACNPSASFVFDDYGDRADYGVKRFVDRYLPEHVENPDIRVIGFPYESSYDSKRDHKMAIWSPNGQATSENFGSFLGIDQLTVSTLRRASRFKANVRKFIPR